MEASELWVESYQGEVLSEALFRTMAEREKEPERRQVLETLAVLERSTKELAEPVFVRRRLGHGDTAATVAAAVELADTVAAMSWEQFLASIPLGTEPFQAIYRSLVELADDVEEREVAEAYVAHEKAFVSFARRALGEENGDPLEPILALPHVAAAVAP